jgi:hypothetical protein
MAPTEEATFITLWLAGTEQAEIGRQLGIPRGTVSSRAMGLVRQGKNQPRPKGGAYPRSKAQGRDHSSSSVQRPVQTPVQITALPPFPQGKAVRWNLWILDAIRDELAALAAERGVSPSQLVQEFLWQVLTDRRSATL